jgi:hypothetical protein
MKKWWRMWLNARPREYLLGFSVGFILIGIIAFIALREGWIQNPWIILYSAIAGGIIGLMVGPVVH